MSEKLNKNQVYKDIIDVCPIDDPKIITRLTSNINDIERTLAMCDQGTDREVRKVIITYLKVTKQLQEQNEE